MLLGGGGGGGGGTGDAQCLTSSSFKQFVSGV